MKIKLSENIKKYRKENSFTQEQLAEALGVTVGAVSKWESGSSQPELGLILEMADLFDLSVDVLLGYELRSNGKESVAARLKAYAKDKAAPEALAEAEKALQKYPNCFEVVYRSASLFMLRGLEAGQKKWLRRAQELLRRSCLLLDQNTDDKISEFSILNEIAEIHNSLEEYDTAVELLKQNNPCGINDPQIGYTLAAGCSRPKEALPYLSHALLAHASTQFQITMGYVNVFFKQDKDYESALSILQWNLDYMNGLKKPGKISFLDKTEATLLIICAECWYYLGNIEKAKESLKQALETAERFDAAPNYSGENIRFVDCQDPGTAYDDMGATAAEGIRRLVEECEDSGFTELWNSASAEWEAS